LIYADKKYEEQEQFVLNKTIVANKKINLDADDRNEIGGFYISSAEYIFRWLIRGDTLCEVKIPDGEKIYKTTSNNGIFVANKIILTNPQKVDDVLAMKLYKNSRLPEISYFYAMTACAIRGYMKTAMKVVEDKVNKENVNIAIHECEKFYNLRKAEYLVTSKEEEERVNELLQKLKSYC